MSDTREIIAARLATVRKDHGWTMDEAATRMGFTRSRYSNWELAIRSPKFDELQIAATVLGVSPAYLAGWSDSSTESDYHPVNRTSVLDRTGANVHIANATDIAAYRGTYLDKRRLASRQLLSILIDDDAMGDVVRRGDVVLVDMQRQRSEIRDLFAILVNDRVWVRWIRPELSGNYTLSAEDKSQYPDETLTPEQLAQLNIIGRIARIERDR